MEVAVQELDLREVFGEEEELPVSDALLRIDIKKAAEEADPQQRRWLIATYYSLQKERIRMFHRARTVPHNVLTSYFQQEWLRLEKEAAAAINAYLKKLLRDPTREDARWLILIRGIGPILAVGLLSHIDIEKTKSASSIWRFAGLDPTAEWKRGQKRPWNLQLKTLCWKVAQSFKMHRRRGGFYSRLYEQRRALEEQRNESRAYAELAAKVLQEKPDHKQAEYYREGKLPPGRIDLRAMRWTVKLFLQHLYVVMYESHYGKEPSKPYVIEHGGHVDYIAPPNWPIRKLGKV